MSKKNKKEKLAAKTRTNSENEPQEELPRTLAGEYQYVLDDLKRVGIIAALLIAVLIGLSIVL